MKNFGFPRHVLIVGILFVSALIALRISSAQERTYKIGDRGPAGGWIFYDKGDSTGGWRYFEAAPDDQGTAIWGCLNVNEITGFETEVGTGKINTERIIKQCNEEDTAAQLAVRYKGGGVTDWYLPSVGELRLMRDNLAKNDGKGFKPESYWSSSFAFINLVHTVVFKKEEKKDKGVFSNTMATKDSRKVRVRAVRSF